jgi:hypothetical protein
VHHDEATSATNAKLTITVPLRCAKPTPDMSEIPTAKRERRFRSSSHS